MEGASVPDKPDAPQTKLLLLAALVVGLGAGVAAALLLDLVRNRANRVRLAAPDASFPLLAIVERDPAYVRRLIGPLPERPHR